MIYTRDDLRKVDLNRLNSVTKYPSIETYHPLDAKRGGALADSEPQVDFGDDILVLTEKIDGANTRIILFRDTFIIASREELLYCDGDVIPNPAFGIVAAVRPIAEAAREHFKVDNCMVLYGETFGGKVTKESKNYSQDGTFGFRLFDVLSVNLPLMMDPEMTDNHVAWHRREGKHGFWLPHIVHSTLVENVQGLFPVPAILKLYGTQLPRTPDAMHDYLKLTLPHTCVLLDSTGKGRPEGLILRNSDRTKIAKARYEDYERMVFLRDDAARETAKAEKQAQWQARNGAKGSP